MDRSKLKRANVSFLSEPIKEGTTGTVIVLTTPDAQRTMLAYQVFVVAITFSGHQIHPLAEHLFLCAPQVSL